MYDDLPRLNQRQAARKLNVSQNVLGRWLKSRQEIGDATPTNESSDGKRKRAGIVGKVEETLKQWFTKVREKEVSGTGPLSRLKAEELANEMSENDFVHIHLFIRGPFVLLTHSVNRLGCSGPKASPIVYPCECPSNRASDEVMISR